MYLQHRGSQSTDKAKNILFYALWALYALSTLVYILDIVSIFPGPESVSMDDHGCLTSFQLVVQNIKIAYILGAIDGIGFAFCDFIAQSILVRNTTGNSSSFI